ncbi:hypothetical protein BJ912DRAFT_1041541 [Pholiota molesta]|nr:hypothetical protein BJ912DRAFT_1041541 [Pholiota molesta]
MSVQSPLSAIFLLHIALEIPVAIQGIWSPANLPFMQLNNTAVVFLSVFALLQPPRVLAWKRALAIGLTVYHTVCSTVLYQAPRFIPHSFGALAEAWKLTPEVAGERHMVSSGSGWWSGGRELYILHKWHALRSDSSQWLSRSRSCAIESWCGSEPQSLSVETSGINANSQTWGARDRAYALVKALGSVRRVAAQLWRRGFNDSLLAIDVLDLDIEIATFDFDIEISTFDFNRELVAFDFGIGRYVEYVEVRAASDFGVGRYVEVRAASDFGVGRYVEIASTLGAATTMVD